jgi:outer membrane protein assembly factor BamB
MRLSRHDEAPVWKSLVTAMKRTLLLCVLLVSKVAFSQPQDVSFLTATSTDGQVLVEFMNPPLGSYDRTRVISRNDRFAANEIDIDFGQPLFVVDVPGVQGKRSFALQSGLQNDQTHFYSVFVTDGESWSQGAFIQAAAVDTVNTPIRWKFVTSAGATLMSPPGIGSVVLVLSNDKTLYPLKRGLDGGIWATGALPYPLSDVSQHRPPVVPPTGPFDGHSITFITTQDGFLSCFNADTGEFLWKSADYGMLTGGPGGWFSTFSSGPDDLAYFGTRNAGERNAIIAVDIADGREVWRFDDPAGTGIGIISGGPTIDYANRSAYFASEEFTSGADTVWAVDLLTGEKIWSTPVGSISGSPVQRGVDLYVGDDAGRVHALDIRDGKPKGNFPFDTGGGTIKGYVFPNLVGNELYLSTQNTVWRIHDDGSRVVLDWAAEVPGASIPTYPPGREFLWVGSSDGSLYQLLAKNGAKNSVTLTSGRNPGVGSPSFDLANGLIYVGTENGEVFAVEVPF